MRNKCKLVKYLWVFAKPYKWSFVNAFVCIFFTSIISMIYPYIFGLLIDEVFYNKNLDFFLLIVGVYAIIYFTEQLLHLILNLLWPYQYNVFLLEVRKAINKKIISLKYNILTQMPVGDMIGMINWQAESFVELLHRNLAYLIADSIKLSVILGMIWFIDYRLAVLLFASTVMSYMSSYILGKKVGEQQEKVRKAYISFTGWIFEMLSGIRDIKLFHAQNGLIEKFNELLENLNMSVCAQTKGELISDRFCAFISMITNIILYIIVAILSYFNDISLGGIVSVITYFATTTVLLDDINWYWGNIHSNAMIIYNIISLLEMESENEKILPDIEVKKGKIEFNSVAFAYDRKSKVLNNINLEIMAGETIALVGKSGVGKSTIANLLLGLISVERGSIKIDGQNIYDYNLQSLREQIGVVQQEIFIFDGTIRSNLLIANSDATDHQIEEAINNAQLNEYIEKMEKGLETLIGREGVEMSGGEKQRLAIARLFLKNPAIIIFDEATALLDLEEEYAVNRALARLSKNRTSIIIAHRLSTILSIKKIVILENGEIMGCGSHEELLKNNVWYKALFEEQYLIRDRVAAYKF